MNAIILMSGPKVHLTLIQNILLPIYVISNLVKILCLGIMMDTDRSMGIMSM